jgi:hypothetical protein
MSETIYKWAPGYQGGKRAADSRIATPTNFTWYDNQYQAHDNMHSKWREKQRYNVDDHAGWKKNKINFNSQTFYLCQEGKLRSRELPGISTRQMRHKSVQRDN